MAKAILVDTTKCTACRACQVACKQWNQLPAVKTEFRGTYENPPDFRGTYTRVRFNEEVKDGKVRWLFAKTQCMHCTEAACVMVCPTGAIHKSEFGTVVIDANKCIGCNYCIANCTFGVIYFDKARNRARKCDMCYDRMQAGQTPACAKACLTGCLQYGERAEILAKAQAAAGELTTHGVQAQIYGQQELGGLGWVYVLADAPEKYGLPKAPEAAATARIWDVIFQPARVVAGLAILFGLWSNRKYSGDLAPAPERPAVGTGERVSAGN